METPKKKETRFITSILIGGALGSFIAWIFGSKRRREVIAEKTETWWQKLLRRKP